MLSSNAASTSHAPSNPGASVESTQVCVIGAGVAGLHAAHELCKQGIATVVLEARERVGGRLLGHRVNGVDLDLGASWFWPGEIRVERLVDELDIKTHAHYLVGDAMYHDRPTARRLDGNPIDVPSGRFSQSAASLTDALATRLNADSLRLDAAAQSIRTSDEGVTITYHRGVINAAQVVLALPPALVAHALTIEPDLPQPVAGLAAMTPVWMGAIAKIVAVYNTPFWRDAGLAGAAISHFGPLREIHDMSGPDGSPAALFGFAPLAVGAEPPTSGEVVAQLTEIFGVQASSPIEVVIHDWSTEEFTSPPDVASLGSYETFGHAHFQQPTGHRRLHWASTETATVAPGHIEGALAAAERAVGAIATALQ